MFDPQVDAAVRFVLANQKRNISVDEFLNQWPFHRKDMITLNVARKTKSLISKVPKSHCDCEAVKVA